MKYKLFWFLLFLFIVMAMCGCTTVTQGRVKIQKAWFVDRVRICNDEMGMCSPWVTTYEFERELY